MSGFLIIGSINMDLVTRVNRMPIGGETIQGVDLNLIPGGKGANQAVAVSRLGGNAFMAGKVGHDLFGKKMLQALKNANVNVQHVLQDISSSTGTATIIVEETGENRIIVVPGANGKVQPDDILALEDEIKEASAILLQFEIPLETIETIVNIAHKYHTPVFVNPAPAMEISQATFEKIYCLIVNELEGETYSGIRIKDIESAKLAAEHLYKMGIPVVAITLGNQGAVLRTMDDVMHIPAPEVEVMDTTAAGDTFVGALSLNLVNHVAPIESLKFAVAAASLAVTKKGAQPSIPTKAEVDNFLSQ